jgi:ABC-2 type transport system permease protein/lipopolysaccharide transport system permease protein
VYPANLCYRPSVATIIPTAMALIDVTSSAPARRLPDALTDLREGLAHWELWVMLGWNDIRQRYRRSIVGPFWITISMAAMIGGLGYMYAGLFNQKLDEYLVYLAAGIIVFNFISSVLTDGTHVFISSARPILQAKAPMSIYVYQMIWRNILIFLHNISIMVILVVVFQVKLGLGVLLALAGLALLTVNGVWAGLLLGALSARFRDIPPIVASLMQVAFFLTPIFWKREHLPDREAFVDLNPFYYFVEVVRMPLLGHTPPARVWLVVLAMTVVGGLVSLLFFARYRRRIAYWV